MVSLDPALRYYLDSQRFLSDLSVIKDAQEIQQKTIERSISSIPQDIQRKSAKSPELVNSNHRNDPLRHTRKGRVNPFPTMKRQLKAERKRLVKLHMRGNFNKS